MIRKGSEGRRSGGSELSQAATGRAVARVPTDSPVPNEFRQLLLEIHRYRLLRLKLAPPSNPTAISPSQAAVLALLWEVDARQRGEPSTRYKATDLGLALGLQRAACSEQTGPLSNLGFCAPLPKEPSQKDRRKNYYVITDEGKRALTDWLEREYTLPEGIYEGAGIDRARQALERLRAEVKTRIKLILP